LRLLHYLLLHIKLNTTFPFFLLMHRLVVAGFIFRVTDPGSDFNQRYVSGALK
jgi:hypothetical protein